MAPHTKIGIVMAYYNRKKQLQLTLDTIQMSAFTDFQVVIVDDGSSEEDRLEDIIHLYSFNIQLIRINPQDKSWCNPCVPYNMAIAHCNSDIIIIQNPEVCHIGDVMSYVSKRLNANDYFAFSCFASPGLVQNSQLQSIIHTSGNVRHNVMNKFVNALPYDQLEFDWKFYARNNTAIKTTAAAHDHWVQTGSDPIKSNRFGVIAHPVYISWKGWYNHPIHHPRPFHFLTATFSANIRKINGFDERYSSGLWYDDDDFLQRISLICKVSNIPDTEVFGIHLYHVGGSAAADNDALIAQNKKLLADLNARISQPNAYDWHIHGSVIVPRNAYTKSVNRNLRGKTIGIGITTYSDVNTSNIRLNIIAESLATLLANKDNVLVYVIVDGFTPRHKLLLNKYANSFKIIYRSSNGGISRAKNTCIKALLDANVDIGFLADDDMIYKKGWYRAYASAMLETHIDHFAFWPRDVPVKIIKVDKDHQLYILPEDGYAGCFITFTPNVIRTIGYFAVFPYRYGHEHVNFTKRAVQAKLTPNHYDLPRSDAYIELNPKSTQHKSFNIDATGIELNQNHLKNIQLYVPFAD